MRYVAQSRVSVRIRNRCALPSSPDPIAYRRRITQQVRLPAVLSPLCDGRLACRRERRHADLGQRPSCRALASGSGSKRASDEPVTDRRTLLMVGTTGVQARSSPCQIATYRLPPSGAVMVVVGWRNQAVKA
jgi:hypothetical protein